MVAEFCADDPRTRLERILAGGLGRSDAPEIARRRRNAIRLAVGGGE